MAPITSRDHLTTCTSDNGGPTLQYPFPPYRGPQAQPHRNGTIVTLSYSPPPPVCAGASVVYNIFQ